MYADPASAPVSGEVKAALRLIEVFTLHPDDLAPAHIEEARAAGLSDEAIEHVFDVSAMFNMIDRIADSFEFHVLDKEGFDRGAQMLLKFGYRFMPLLWPGHG